MFEEDYEDKKAGILGTVILVGGGALAGFLGKLGFDKGKSAWEAHKAKKEAEASEDEAK